MSEVEETKGTEEEVVSTEQEAQAEAGITEGDDGEYKIGDQSFRTAQEAFAYANSLVHDKAIVEAQANAYRQAVVDASVAQSGAQNVTQNVPQEEDNFEQRFYEDPKKYLAEMRNKIKEEAKQEILGTVQQQTEDEKLWGEFFKQNPDLADFKEDCEVTLTKIQRDVAAINKAKGQKAAMDFLAQKTRAKFQAYAELSKPKRELERTSSGPSFGSPNNVTRPAPKTQDLDFAAEIRSLRNKRA